MSAFDDYQAAYNDKTAAEQQWKQLAQINAAKSLLGTPTSTLGFSTPNSEMDAATAKRWVADKLAIPKASDYTDAIRSAKQLNMQDANHDEQSALLTKMMNTIPVAGMSVLAPDINGGRFLRGSALSADRPDIWSTIAQHDNIPINPVKDSVGTFGEAVSKAQDMTWLDPIVLDGKPVMKAGEAVLNNNGTPKMLPQTLRYSANSEGMIGNDKMAFPNAQFPNGRNTYDSFGCGRGEFARANEIKGDACYGGDCYAEKLGLAKGRSATEGTSNKGMSKDSDGYKSVKQAWEDAGQDVNAVRNLFPELNINYYPAAGKNPENFSVAIPQPPRGAQVFKKLQNAKGQDIRIGVDTDASAWLSNPDVLNALEKAQPRTITAYSSGYYNPPPPSPLADRSIINVTVSGWHPLPETLKRLQWAQTARDNGWNVILREVVADPATFPERAAEYNRIHDLINKTDFYVMQQPLHSGKIHGTPIGEDAKSIPICCTGSAANSQTCHNCKTSEGLGLGFKEFWEKKGGQPFDDAPILPAIPDYREQQNAWTKLHEGLK